MNIHHLELFYYVATHGGISRAVRQMPYGIQQPAVSSQILQLEEDLGVRLFERTPFKLTPAGQELFGAIQPFFDSLDDLAARVGKKSAARLRIGAAEVVLSEYLPAVLARLRKTQPDFRLTLRAMGTTDIERLFAEGEIDVALSPVDRRPSQRLRRELLVSVPLAFYLPKSSKLRSPEELWSAGFVEQPLICLPPTERVCWLFHDELKRRRVQWPVSIEASSVSLLTRYVASGYGIGVAGYSPDQQRNKAIRVLPLPDFPPLELYAVWQDDQAPLVQALLDEVRRYVREEWSVGGVAPR